MKKDDLYKDYDDEKFNSAAECLMSAVEFLSYCSATTDMVSGRDRGNFISHRIAMASNERSLFECLSLFRSSINVGVGKMNNIMEASSSKYAETVLRLIREFPTEVAGIIFTKKEDKYDICVQLFNLVDLDNAIINDPVRKRRVEIPMDVLMTEPLVHGDEKKQGNAILFRRRPTATGAILPFFSANSVKHQIRVLLAEDYLRRIGLHPSTTDTRYKVWFNEFLHNGGKLGSAPKEFCKIIGGSAAGAVNGDGLIQLSDMMPFITMLGGNAKNSIGGRLRTLDLRPKCKEWGTGSVPCNDLLSWSEFGTTPDPLAATSVSKSEAKKVEKDGGEAQANSSMIYKFQTLAVGTELEGGFGLSEHTSNVERSCLGHGVDLLADHGRLGGKTNIGFGGCIIQCCSRPDPDIYLDHIEKNKEAMVDYINSIGAFK